MIPNPSNLNPQFLPPQSQHNPQEIGDRVSDWARFLIRVAFWSLGVILSLGLAVGVGFVFARGVLWFIRLSTEALGV